MENPSKASTPGGIRTHNPQLRRIKGDIFFHFQLKLYFQYVRCFQIYQVFCSNISNLSNKFYSISPTIVLLFIDHMNSNTCWCKAIISHKLQVEMQDNASRKASLRFCCAQSTKRYRWSPSTLTSILIEQLFAYEGEIKLIPLKK